MTPSDYYHRYGVTWDVSSTFSPEVPAVVPPMFVKVTYPFMLLVGLVGNSAIVVTYTAAKSLRKPSNLFIVNLAIADAGFLCCAILQMYPAISSGGRRVATDLGCRVGGTAMMLAGVASMQFIGLIGASRYVTIIHPLRAGALLTWRKCACAAVLAWLYPLPILAPVFAGHVPIVWKPKEFLCAHDWNTSLAHNLVLGIFSYSLVTFATLYFYWSIYAAFRRSRRRVRAGAGVGGETPGARGIKKDDLRLAAQLLVVYIIYNMSWLPYSLLEVFVDPHGELPVETHCALITILLINPLVNFFIYLIFNRTFRTELVRIFSCGKITTAN